MQRYNYYRDELVEDNEGELVLYADLQTISVALGQAGDRNNALTTDVQKWIRIAGENQKSANLSAAALAENEEIIRSLLVTLDISAQQRAEEGLKAEEQNAALQHSLKIQRNEWERLNKHIDKQDEQIATLKEEIDRLKRQVVVGNFNPNGRMVCRDREAD